MTFVRKNSCEMATLKLTALTLSLVHLSVIISGQDTVLIVEPSDQTKDENEAIFLACQVQYLDRSTHVVSWILGNTIISDDGYIRTEALNDKLGEGAASRYQIAISVIPPNPRIYVYEMFITQAKGVDNGGELRCAVCPQDQNGQCNGSFEVESRIATLDVKYRPDTTLYPKCINPSESESETIVVLGQTTTTLTCESEIANPPVGLEWRKNTLVVSGTMPPDTAGMRRLDYEMNPAIDDDGAIFTCTVSSEYFDDLTDTQCSLPPVKVVSIPDVNIESPDQVVNGTRAEYTCSATSQTNAAMEAYAWTVEGLTSDRYNIDNSNFQSVLTIERIEENDQDALVKCFVTDSDDQVGEDQVMILIKGLAPTTGYTNPPGGTTNSVSWSNWNVLDMDWITDDCCDGNPQSRLRDCIDPLQSGLQCDGPSFENKTCDPAECYTDECVQSPPVCHANATCTNTDGGYTCDCRPGFVGDGRICTASGAILVRQTTTFLISGSPLIEGRNNHIVTFNLAVFPDLAVSYNVLGSNLWTISVYLNNQQDGQGERIAETVAPLSSEQMNASWIPPNTMNFGNVQTLINLDMVTCRDMWYLCATINRGMNPSPVFFMEGSPTNASLTGCTTVSCTGVRILNTAIVWKSQNDLREGFTQQNVQFDIRMTPDPAGGSVTGINLWRVLLFGNINAQGSNERIMEQDIPIVEPNSRRSIQAGVQTTLSDLTTTINMQGLKCEEILYICVEILPGPNADPSFTLTGDLMSCYQIPCRGTNIIGTSFEIDIGNPLVERSGQHDITFDLLLLPDPTGGAAIGSNLWAVSLFATSGSSTDRVSPTVQVALSSFQSGTSLRPPGTSRVSNVQTSLNLEGRLCSELFAVCAVLTKGPFATPDYTFETAPGDPALTACTNVECQAECTDQYACHDGLLCISFRRVCDGYPDCTDNSDELPLTCAYYRTTTEVPSDYQTTEAATYTPGDSYLSPLIVIVTSAIGGVILVIIILCIARIVLRRKKKLTASMLTALEEISTPQLTLSTMNSTFEGEEDDIDLSPAFLDPAGESTDVSFENPLYGESNA